MQCSLFGLLLFIPAAAAVPTYGSLADFVGENADDADVINVTRCDAYLEYDFDPISMSYYSYGGWGTVVCGVDCPETALTYGGCWDTGVTYDTTICTVAKQAGIPVGQRFAYYVNPYTNIDMVGCDANGVDGTPGYGTTGESYKLVLQENIGNSTGVVVNDGGDTITSEMYVLNSCDYSGQYSAAGYFAFYRAEFAYFEMKCSVACDSSHLVFDAAGCPDVAANGYLSYCVAAAMLGIPPMSPFVVKYLADSTIPVAGCSMNGINTQSGSASTPWKIVAANRLTTTSISTTTSTTSSTHTSKTSSTTSGTHTSTMSSATSTTSTSTTSTSATSTSATSTSATSTQTATTETSTTTTASTNTATATTATTTTTTTTTWAAVNSVERAGVKLAVLVLWGMLFFV